MGGGASKATQAAAKPVAKPVVITITDETVDSNGRCYTAPLTKPQTLVSLVHQVMCQQWGLEQAKTQLCSSDGTPLLDASMTLRQAVDAHGPAMVLRSVGLPPPVDKTGWLAAGDPCSFTLDEACPDHATHPRFYGVFPGTVDFCIEPTTPGSPPRYKIGANTQVMASIKAKLLARGVGVGDGYWATSINSGQTNIFLDAAKVERGHDAALAFWDKRAQASTPKSFAVGDECSVRATSTSGGGNRMYAGVIVAADNARQRYDVKWLNKPPSPWVEKNVHSSRLVAGQEAGYAPDIEAKRIAKAQAEADARRRAEHEQWRAAEWAKIEARKPALLAEFKAYHPDEEPVFWCPTIGDRHHARYVTKAMAEQLREELRQERERDRAEMQAAMEAGRVSAAAAASTSSSGGSGGGASSGGGRGRGACRTGRLREESRALTKHQAPTGACHKGKRFTTGKCPVCGAATGTI